MDLQSVQATDREIQTDKKDRKNMGSARGRVRQSDTTRDTMARSDEKVTLNHSESCPGQNTGEDLQPCTHDLQDLLGPPRNETKLGLVIAVWGLTSHTVAP